MGIFRKGKFLSQIFVERPAVTVFVVNFCIMTLELVAGRMIAPYVGVSLYTWTGVIGVVLLGISIGNLYGGKIADIRPQKDTVGFLLVGAGISSLTTVFLLRLLAPGIALSQAPYISQVLLITSVFLIPSMMLGAISPIIVKLSLRDLTTSGNVVGKIYAAAALGSIVGTYATGFYLISRFGVRAIMVIVSAVTFLVANAYIDLWSLIDKHLGKRRARLLAVFLVLATLAVLVDRNQSCFRESNYYCIKILQDEEGRIRRLVLDKLMHSITDMNNPTNLEYDYEKLVASLYASIYVEGKQPKVLLLGGGGYTFPRYLVHYYSDPDVTVVEIDPQVTAVAYEEFDMPNTPRVVTVNSDARMFLSRLNSSQKYSLVFGDAFADFSIPYHLTTKEFGRLVYEQLADDGFYAVNVIDNLEPGLFLKSYIRTLSKVFEQVYLFDPDQNGEGKDRRNTYVVVAGKRPLDWQLVKMMAGELGYEDKVVTKFSDAELASFLSQQQRQIVLTDDYAPVDNLIAPVYIKSFPSLAATLSFFWGEASKRILDLVN